MGRGRREREEGGGRREEGEGGGRREREEGGGRRSMDEGEGVERRVGRRSREGSGERRGSKGWFTIRRRHLRSIRTVAAAYGRLRRGVHKIAYG